MYMWMTSHAIAVDVSLLLNANKSLFSRSKFLISVKYTKIKEKGVLDILNMHAEKSFQRDKACM